MHIFTFEISASAELQTQKSETVILVELSACKIVAKHSVLDIHYFKDFMTPSVYDNTVPSKTIRMFYTFAVITIYL